MWTTLSVLQAIITAPLVQRSRESNIPLWLSLPIVGCYTLGILLILSPWTTEVRDLYVIAITYVLCGGAFSAAMLIGVFLKCYTVLNRYGIPYDDQFASPQLRAHITLAHKQYAETGQTDDCCVLQRVHRRHE